MLPFSAKFRSLGLYLILLVSTQDLKPYVDCRVIPISAEKHTFVLGNVRDRHPIRLREKAAFRALIGCLSISVDPLSRGFSDGQKRKPSVGQSTVCNAFESEFKEV
jgi:hypothetical protein